MRHIKIYENFGRPVISYDFDGVLHKSVRGIHPVDMLNFKDWEPFEEMHARMREDAKDHDIVVVTARTSFEEVKNAVDAFIKLYDLPVKEVIYTDNKPKLPYLKSIKTIRHYDDNPALARDLEGTGIEFEHVDPKLYESHINEMMDGYQENGIVLIKGNKLGDGTYPLYGAHLKRVLNYGRTKVSGKEGKSAKMVLLYDDLFRIKKTPEGYRAGKTMEDERRTGLKSMRVVLNHNKTPYHWDTTKYQYFPKLLKEYEPVFDNMLDIKWD